MGETFTSITVTPAIANGQDTELLAEQIYDLLMAEIEPDLMLANLSTLDAKYKGESEAEKQARMRRYERAYAEFDRRFTAFMNEVQDDVREGKREALSAREEEMRTQEQADLSSLEAAFS